MKVFFNNNTSGSRIHAVPLDIVHKSTSNGRSSKYLARNREEEKQSSGGSGERPARLSDAADVMDKRRKASGEHVAYTRCGMGSLSTTGESSPAEIPFLAVPLGPAVNSVGVRSAPRLAASVA
ncbi:uncharacterized protein LOC108140115 isoform X2 [Drosophila elegans]|uniref:uncharacterized protein LOC108140115 isoform X2 n=1 Tax=Drosophila elegans TaxID=30023 RepID=UPI0007E7D18B|nr:uncharacterized protein LOC108140115 isoform X2 [Drosophila elegans]